jgi:hypothetical protein
MEILDQAKIQQIVRSFFIKNTTLLRLPDGKDIEVIQIQYETTNIRIKYKSKPPQSASRILICNAGNIFIFELKFVKALDTEEEILSPIKMVVHNPKKEVDPKSILLAEKDSPKIIVSNIIGQNEIKNFQQDERLKNIIKSHSTRLVHLFHKYKIFIQEKQDERMKLMRQYEQPIFIPDLREKFSVPDGFVPHYGFAKLIKIDEIVKDGYVAEICIPIIFRNFTMIGYVQIQHKSVLDLNSYNLASFVSASIKKDISDFTNNFESKEKCNIVSINQAELNFIHPNNKIFNKIFANGEICIINILTIDIKLTVAIKIQKIEPTEKGFLISSVYHNMTLEQLELIEQIIEKYS